MRLHRGYRDVKIEVEAEVDRVVGLVFDEAVGHSITEHVETATDLEHPGTRIGVLHAAVDVHRRHAVGGRSDVDPGSALEHNRRWVHAHPYSDAVEVHPGRDRRRVAQVGDLASGVAEL